MNTKFFSILVLFLIIGSADAVAQNNFTPKYSPDGERIAFYRYINGTPEIMVINRDGTNLKQVTSETGNWSIGPVWSDDGEEIIFSHGRNMQSLDINVLNLETNKQNLIEVKGTEFVLGLDARGQLIWAKRTGKDTKFYKFIDSNLTKSEEIKVDGFSDYWVFIHPEKDSYFVQVKDPGKEGLYAIRDKKKSVKILDKQNIRNLTVSEDATKIAFEMEEEGNTDIYIADINGENMKRITTHDLPDYMPEFAKDGNSLVFSSARSGAYHIYSIDLNTQEISQITY